MAVVGPPELSDRETIRKVARWSDPERLIASPSSGRVNRPANYVPSLIEEVEEQAWTLVVVAGNFRIAHRNGLPPQRKESIMLDLDRRIREEIIIIIDRARPVR